MARLSLQMEWNECESVCELCCIKGIEYAYFEKVDESKSYHDGTLEFYFIAE